MSYYIKDSELAHHGILGMRWGFRRFQNEDGSLTAAGRQRYDVGEARTTSGSENSSQTKKTGGITSFLKSKISKSSTVAQTKNQNGSNNTEESNNNQQQSNTNNTSNSLNLLKNKTVDELSDSEAKAVATRIGLNRAINNYTKEQAEKNKSIVQKALDKTGKIVTEAVVEELTNQGKNAVKKMIKGALGDNSDNNNTEAKNKNSEKKTTNNSKNESNNQKKNANSTDSIKSKVEEAKKKTANVDPDQTGERKSNIIDGEWAEVSDSSTTNNSSKVADTIKTGVAVAGTAVSVANAMSNAGNLISAGKQFLLEDKKQ